MTTDTSLDFQAAPNARHQIMGHPAGLFVLFLVEMWERFSYYGMRGLLVLYLVKEASGANPGRGMTKEAAGNLYGIYTGMAYLLPILGGVIADKLIGAHRSMLIGGVLIALGHVALAVSGLGDFAHNHAGLSIFVFGLALIVIGTGHFKPNVSVMVGKLYPKDDPRRDSAFTIFYMGINLGAFLCAFVCGTLGEKLGWHWGFGSAAIGMILGLLIYITARPRVLPGVGDPPPGRGKTSPLFFIGGILLAALIGGMFYTDIFSHISAGLDGLNAYAAGRMTFAALPWAMIAALVLGSTWFSLAQPVGDRGPTAAILLFIFFNAVFWLAFEQAGSSLNLFADEMTRRTLGTWEMPATWFQSVGPLEIILLAPVFAGLWSWLARRNLNPSQPMKMTIGLFLLGLGYIFMVAGAYGTSSTHKASMFWLIATYTMLTFGELCISPTGLSFVSKVAPAKHVSFLMGMFFLSNAVANWAGGRIAGQIEAIEKGTLGLPWYPWFKLGGQSDFFLLFVFSSLGAALVMLILTPLVKRMLGGRA